MKLAFALITFLLTLPLTVFAEFEISTTDNGIAVNAYDPVSYFQEKPLKGNDNFQYQHNSATYFFSSKSNKDKFIATPNTYLPEYGGYCSYGVKLGKKLETDPFSYTLINGKLYFLLNRATHKMWSVEKDKNIAIANRIWPLISIASPKSLE